MRKYPLFATLKIMGEKIVWAIGLILLLTTLLIFGVIRLNFLIPKGLEQFFGEERRIAEDASFLAYVCVGDNPLQRLDDHILKI